MDDPIIKTVRVLLSQLGEDPKREGLLETPKRVAKAWRVWAGGMEVADREVGKVLKCFKDGSEGYDGMVLQSGIPFFSHCEHHMAPFFGTATIAYVPRDRVVGLSKLSRVLQIYAQRLQVQERLTRQVADAICTHLEPRGVAISLTARHFCMESRGIQQQGIVTTTTALRGCFKEDEKTRAEFMAQVVRTA